MKAVLFTFFHLKSMIADLQQMYLDNADARKCV